MRGINNKQISWEPKFKQVIKTKNSGQVVIYTKKDYNSNKIIIRITTKVGTHTNTIGTYIDEEGLEELVNCLTLMRYELQHGIENN